MRKYLLPTMLLALVACDRGGSGEESKPDKPAKSARPSATPAASTTKPAADEVDHTSDVKQHMEAMLQAIATKDTEKVEPLLLGMMKTPEDATTWFGATFGPDLGPKLGKEWEEKVFAEMPKLIRPFRQANEAGQTQVTVQRIQSASDANATGYQKAAVAKMVKPTALYSATFAKPGESSGITLSSFVYVDGNVFFVGEMGAAK